MDKAGIAYQALDNGFLSCADPDFLQKRCDQLGTGAVRDFFWRWFWRLPSPFTKEDLDAGYIQIRLVFQRPITRRTPGPFRTRVITKGVEPILTCYYKSSRLKQYFKEGRGLRELVISDTHDFGIGRRDTN